MRIVLKQATDETLPATQCYNLSVTFYIVYLHSGLAAVLHYASSMDHVICEVAGCPKMLDVMPNK